MKHYNYYSLYLISVTFFFFTLSIVLLVILICQNKIDNIETQQAQVIEVEKEVEVEVVRYPTEYELVGHTDDVIYAIAKTVWGEARGLSTTEQAAVVWCIFNRADDERFPDDIIDVITQENQFDGYKEDNLIDDNILFLVKDVFYRWTFEKDYAIGNVGRVLPKEYCWFVGNGSENIFRDAYNGNYSVWDWTLNSPYED